MRLKFYADENVPVAVSVALKKRGVDVLTAHEAGMLQKDDLQQLFFAASEKRALICQKSLLAQTLLLQLRESQRFLSMLKTTRYGL